MSVHEDKKTGNLIFICVDNCEHSLRAFNWYYQHFYRTQDRIGIVYVYSRPELPPYGYVEGYPVEVYERESKGWYEEEIKKGDLITAPYQELCKERGIKYVTFIEEKVESIGHTICDLANEKQAKCIVMGQRGLGAIKRTMLGSVSEHVLHHAHMTVLIVPPPKGHKCTKY